MIYLLPNKCSNITLKTKCNQIYQITYKLIYYIQQLKYSIMHNIALQTCCLLTVAFEKKHRP